MRPPHQLALLLLLACACPLTGCSDDASASGASGATGAGGAGAAQGSGTQGSGASSGEGGASGGQGGGAQGSGIASMFPGDQGIEEHPDVLLFDGFEDYAAPDDLYERWDAVYQTSQIAFPTDPALVRFGAQSLEFNVPQQGNELSNAVDKVLSQELDVLFLRYYARFQAPYDVVGSSHNGSSISAHYFQDGQATPGVPANGTNKFLVNLENWRGEAATASPGHLNLYVYHPEQRSQWGDHFFPTGVVLPNSSEPFDFGASFVPQPDVIPALDQWYCYEYMVQANTPGQRDGRITVWLDGERVADFGNLRFRDVADLMIDRFGLSFHIGSNPNGETKKWFDNVVAARSYIGPVAE